MFACLYSSFKLVLTGSDTGNLDYIRKQIESLGLEKHVIICGFVSNDHLFTLYKSTISLVMPTFLGPTNMPSMEALALGCYCICSDFEGHRSQIGSEGYFVNPADPNDIYEKMSMVVDRPPITWSKN